MKRSKINAVIKDMEKLINNHGFQLPPYIVKSFSFKIKVFLMFHQ